MQQDGQIANLDSMFLQIYEWSAVKSTDHKNEHLILLFS